MKLIRKKRRQFWLALLLCTCMLGQITVYSAWANDRSAEIIGSSPLLVPGVISPAGLSGQGQIVGIADSGLDKGSMSDIHPDLQTAAGAKPKVILQSYTDRDVADDPNGHGTFMAATIAGTGKASNGKYKGIAPGASLYFQALLDRNNVLKVPDQVSDLFSPAYAAGVRIHVDGWGGGSNTYSSIAADIDKFIYGHPDFLPVFGAGNSGPDSGTLTAQANSKNALVVGSSQVPRAAFDPESNFADQVAASSSLGPAGDGRIKPDLLAPGSALISACSSLVESNFAANSAYTRMGGSSMAAAVTGGALALLREQLNSQLQITSPSSALLKALLINGARSTEGNVNQQGFGILDSAGTALALKEGTFKFNDEKSKLMQGESRDFKFQVTDTSMPVKITLAWTDPPGDGVSSSALVNNLDLVVKDPTGNIYYGNDFNNQEKVDTLNNVEQVAIQLPKAGEYTVTVKAGKIGYGTGQDFALVYGQVLKTGVVKEADQNQFTLTDNSTFRLDTARVQQVIDGAAVESAAGIQVGSEVYLSSRKAYIFGATWKTGGIQALPTEDGDLLLEMNRQVREGGYYLDPEADAIDGSITVNDQPVDSIEDIPTGSQLTATINPFLQTLWKLEASNKNVTGLVAQVNAAARELTLLNDSHTYTLAPWVAISYRDKIVDCTPQDTPYGSGQANDLTNLLPGTKVTMQVSPQSGTVQSLLLERSVAVGVVTKVNVEEKSIVLDTGQTYRLFPGTGVYRDMEAAELEDIQIGDRITAVLLPDSSTIVQIQAFSNVSYGRVVYASPQQNSLYIIDADNHSHTYVFDKNTEIFGWGIPLEAASINSGSWIKVISDSSGRALRVDLAEVGETATKTVSSIDLAAQTMHMSDGTDYQYGNYTYISKGGYTIDIKDVAVGDTLEITTLQTASPWPQLLAGAEIDTPAGVAAPDLKMAARALNGVLIIEGTTSADCVYLYRQDGSRERIQVTNGSFARVYNLLENESSLTAAALDTRTGAMNDMDVKITAITAGPAPSIFNDISGHWAEKYIVDLAQKNVVKGYDDGSFRPDQTISRAELMVEITQLQKLTATVIPDEPYFTDYQDIPWWALQAVIAAKEKGLIYGYPDGSFQPNRAVTRSELAIIYSHITKQGLTNLFPGETLQPDRPVTRAEVMAILDLL
jgi:Subtilisin-like serine proteases